MLLLVLVLNKVQCLEAILENFIKSGIKGATVIDSTGMAKILCDDNHIGELPIFGSLKMFVNEKYPYNKTIFVVIEDKDLDKTLTCIKKETGDLKKPGVGIVFTVPLSYMEGINFTD